MYSVYFSKIVKSYLGRLNRDYNECLHVDIHM